MLTFATKTFLKTTTILVAVLLCVIILKISDPWAVRILRHNTFDIFQKISPNQKENSQIILVEIDEKSLKTQGQWPWQRNILANLADKILRQSPQALAIDIVFPEPDRTSPSLILDNNPALIQQLKTHDHDFPSYDNILADVLKGHPVILGMATGYGTDQRAPVETTTSIKMYGDDVRSTLPKFNYVLRNIEQLEKVTTQGVNNLAPERDGIIRQLPLLYNVNGTIIPSFEIETLRIANNADEIELTTKDSKLKSIRLDSFDLTMSNRGKPWIYFSKNSDYTKVSANDILTDTIDDTLFKDKIVILGVTALGIANYSLTPVGSNLSGLAIHAQALDNMLTDTLLTRPSSFFWMELSYLLLIGILFLAVHKRHGALEVTVTFAILCWITILLSSAIFTLRTELFDPSLPLILTLIMFMISVSTGFVMEQTRRREEARIAEQKEREKEARIRKLQNELLHTIGKSSVQKLSSSIAHELNQPLAAIYNFANAARKILDRDNINLETVKPVLEKILNQADRGNEILRTIRDAAETGKTNLSSLNINKIIIEEIELLNDSGFGRKVNINTSLSPEITDGTANEIQLHQVLLNLIRNAKQATEEIDRTDHEILISTCENPKGMIEVAVSDTGPGLTEDQKTDLFKPFFTTKEQGTGLGLAISRSIIEAWGGNLWVEDNDKGGATFKFTLPLNN
ncbi:CHASE2 domain-containing protein [Kiloniella sp. EL199]|uniref:CHASE2 domain-containing protein n=1 Tax=Kiloniella sp. EL199 TaxID=2107581 RepID=UPI000EA2A0E8|nr:CHASE2 domain-containing protein [Kiloniella sp. EL199]